MSKLPSDHSKAPKSSKTTGKDRLSRVMSSSTRVRLQDPLDYTPDPAICVGMEMMTDVQKCLQDVHFGNPLRKELWMRDIASLLEELSSKTVIAIVGGTGEGKSSLINAMLGDQILPTDCMQACTPFATEISHSLDNLIQGEVCFITEDDWREELQLAQNDIKHMSGSSKSWANLPKEVRETVEKVNLVYPNLTSQMVADLNIDDIVGRDARVRKLLATTQKISTQDAKSFRQALADFVDPRALINDVETAVVLAGGSTATGREPVLWPLIKRVKIKYNAPALASGAVLVDLPGIGDVNHARNAIAQEYMKACDRIWIVSSIHRAKDSALARELLGDAFKLQLAMDANYDASKITFIATKTDVRCHEMAGVLEGSPELEEINASLSRCEQSIAKWKHLHDQAADECANLESQPSVAQVMQQPTDHSVKTAPVVTERRKRTRDEDDGEELYIQVKRRLLLSPNHAQIEDLGNDNHAPNSLFPSPSGSSTLPPTAIYPHSDNLVNLLERLAKVQKTKVRAVEHLDDCRREKKRLEQSKTRLFAVKRIEIAKEKMKQDFRDGLREHDAFMAQDNDDFDPDVSIRRYDQIDVNVLACSSVDYARITGKVADDGASTCFTNLDDTGIPQAQRWCHYLGAEARDRASRGLLSRIKTFCNSLYSDLQEVKASPQTDWDQMQKRWDSVQRRAVGRSGYSLRSRAFAKRAEKWKGLGNCGITPRLMKARLLMDDDNLLVKNSVKELDKVAEQCSDDLKAQFQNGLGSRCNQGIEAAIEEAHECNAKFAAWYWSSYRGLLNHCGVFKGCDMNMELVNPYTKKVAASWVNVFQSDLLANVEYSAMKKIDALLEDFEHSAPTALQKRTKKKCETCRAEAQLTVKTTLSVVRKTLNLEQKEISRTFAPHVQGSLVAGYKTAASMKGVGSVRKQKDYFALYLDERKEIIFAGGVDVIMDRLGLVADAVGDALKEIFDGLAQKCEVTLSALWETLPADGIHQRSQAAAMSLVLKVIDRITALQQADGKHLLVDDL